MDLETTAKVAGYAVTVICWLWREIRHRKRGNATVVKADAALDALAQGRKDAADRIREIKDMYSTGRGGQGATAR